MSEASLNDIFSEIENDTKVKERKTAREKITSAQVVSGLLMGLAAFGSLWATAVCAVLLLLSFWRPFLSLFITSAAWGFLFLAVAVGTTVRFTNPNDEKPTAIGLAIGATIWLFLIYLLIRGTMAAKKYEQLKKNPKQYSLL